MVQKVFKRAKRIKLKPDSWYIIDARNIIKPKALDERFISKKGANKYVERRFNSDFKHYIPIKGKNLIKFNVEFSHIKRYFYSKYCIPDRKILTAQGKKTFRTTIRRKLFGYVRKEKYSHFCDRCRKSHPWDPTFARIRKTLFNGRRRRLCDKCHRRNKEEIKSKAQT